jgi:hypothetical protein
MNKKETQTSKQRNRYTTKKQAVYLMNGDAKKMKRKTEEQSERQTDTVGFPSKIETIRRRSPLVSQTSFFLPVKLTIFHSLQMLLERLFANILVHFLQKRLFCFLI